MEADSQPMNGCEVRDYVVNPDETRVLRMQNEAANVELARRGETTVPSGEVAPYAIAWVNTCGGEVIVSGV